MTNRRYAWLLLGCAACLHSAAGRLGAQDRPRNEGDITIVQLEWGFDGKAPARTFVPLSVLVQNDGPNPATGTLRLSKFFGINQKVDAEFEQSYFVSGFSSKWVQLTPLVIGDFENWELRWGPQLRGRMDVPTPRIGEAATVLFADPDDMSTVGSALRRCDPALFPVSVTGTDSLRGAVLHAAPDWQGARVQAFREWLQRGGRVFLVHGENGDFAKFPGELSFLNDARESFAIGQGRVTRLPLSVKDLDAETVRNRLLEGTAALDPDALNERTLRIARGAAMPIWIDFDDYILKELHQLTRFHRSWWLIYLCAALYVLAVFPGSYLLGRCAADWRWFYAGFLGIAVLFSAGFTRLGELGSAERSRTRSVAVAYQLENGLYDLMQWTCAASRNGDRYQLSNAGSGRLFSSCQEVERVNGVVRLQDGRFDLDLPPASTCNIVQRARIAGPALDVQVAGLQVDDRSLRALTLAFAPHVSDDSMIVCAWYRRSIYELTIDEHGAHLGTSHHRGADFINTLGALPFQRRVRANPLLYTDDPATTTEAFQYLLHQAVGATLKLRSGAVADDVALDPTLVRLLIYRPMPDEFRFSGEQFPDQQGFVLYVVDVPVSGGAE